MSTVPILDADGVTRNIDVIPRTEGAEIIETQTIAVTDPATGAPIDFATEATVAALLTAANAIVAAAEAINAKTTAVNTGAVAGTVALDAPTLAALENTTVSVSNMVAQGLTDAQLRASAVPVSGNLTANGTHFQPGYDLSEGAGAAGPLLIDPDGNLVARAQVLTDEGSYRVNFANSSLAVAVGTATFTNGSDQVTGSGFLLADVRTGDYIKLNADAEAAWVQVDSLNSDTSLTLIANYTGTGGTGACSRAIVKPVTGSGGAIAVASGVCTITSGTTTGAITEIERDVDWLPLAKQSGVAVSQRIANQSVQIGFYDETAPTAPKWFAWIVLDGTTNTTAKCQSGRNPTQAPSAAEIEETIITLPNGNTSATARRYKTEVMGDRVCFYVDGTPVATHYKSMPGPGDLLTSTVRIVNGTSPASSTTVTVDYDSCQNHNILKAGLFSDSEQVVALAAPLQPFNYNVAGVIAINTDILIIACAQFRTVSLQATSIGTTGRLDFFLTNDLSAVGTAQPAYPVGGGAGVTTTTAAGMWNIPTNGAAFLRVRLGVATTAGTTTVFAVGSQTAHPIPAPTTQPVSGTVGVTGYPTAAASADGLANPTVTKVDSTGLAFNGTTWDRQRNNISLANDLSSARTASGTGVTFTNHSGRNVAFWLNVTAVSGTTPAMTARVQWSPDNGTTWLDMDTTNLQTVSITATGNFILRVGPGLPVAANLSANQIAPRLMRLAWTITGTTPSFTFTSWANTSA